MCVHTHICGVQYVINSGALDSGIDRRSLESYVTSGGATPLEAADTSGAKEDAFGLIRRFGFERNRAFEKIGALSGGERRRLQLLGVLAKRPNVLLLDEPTNDLDLNTLSVLERYLVDEYEGVLVVVGHDRAFLDSVTNHLFVFEGDGLVRNFEGSFSEYVAFDRMHACIKTNTDNRRRTHARIHARTHVRTHARTHVRTYVRTYSEVR